MHSTGVRLIVVVVTGVVVLEGSILVLDDDTDGSEEFWGWAEIVVVVGFSVVVVVDVKAHNVELLQVVDVVKQAMLCKTMNILTD